MYNRAIHINYKVEIKMTAQNGCRGANRAVSIRSSLYTGA
uniref:Uncharacterized protein n=1 Tax=Heterorhabditis bacteriophora TaxID=37862 RepID=A0A1I7W9L6_HETBA